MVNSADVRCVAELEERESAAADDDDDDGATGQGGGLLRGRIISFLEPGPSGLITGLVGLCN